MRLGIHLLGFDVGFACIPFSVMNVNVHESTDRMMSFAWLHVERVK